MVISDKSVESRIKHYGKQPSEKILTPEKQKIMQENLINEFKKLGEKDDIMKIAEQVLKPKPILEVEVLEDEVLHIIYGEEKEGDGKEDIIVSKNQDDNFVVKSFYFDYIARSDYPSFSELLENPISREDERNRTGGKRGSLDYHDNKDYK